MRNSKVSLIAIMAASSFAMPSVAFAQSETEAEGAIDDGVIIVTARNREESIQDVPLAITAFGEDDIDKRGLQELDDVARFTPGFSFEDFSGGFAQPVVRGLATTRVTALESNVSSFFDGVYIPRSWAVDIGTSNLERIEVVKGPQSARYGRNAFAGAVNYVPKKAKITGEIEGEIEGTVGTDDRYDIGAFVNFSVNDYFAIAASYNYSTFDGSWENSHPFADLDIAGPSTQGNVGGWENQAIGVSAIFQLSDGISLEASYNRFDVKQEARASRYIGDSQGGILDPESITAMNNGLVGITNCGSPRGANFAFICGDLPAPAETSINDPRGYGVVSGTDMFRVSLNAEVTDDLTFSYIFGKVKGDVDSGTSGEPDPINCGTLVPGFCNFQKTPIGSINYDTHEARLTYDNGSIRAAVGGFYSDGVDRNSFTSVNIRPIVDGNNFVPFNGSPTPPTFSFSSGSPFGDFFNFQLGDTVTETKVISVFGELQWTSSDGALRLGAEGRYSETEITSTDIRFGAPSLNDTFKVFTPRFTAEYDMSDEVLLYGSVARGAKAGGFNPGASEAALTVFDPEYNWTFEAGVKSTLADGRLTLNGSIYYTDWTDIQINSGDIDPADPLNPNVPTITQNLGNAKLFGIELAARFQATDYLSFDASFSHTEGEYSSGTFDSRFSRGTPGGTAPCDNIVCNTDGDISGNKIERAPPTQASFGAQLDGEFGSDNSYFIRADTSWQSDFFADSANLGVIPSRFLVNGSAGVSFGDISLRIWARNLLDKKYVSNAFAVLLPFGNTYGEFYGERRTMGLTAKLDF